MQQARYSSLPRLHERVPRSCRWLPPDSDQRVYHDSTVSMPTQHAQITTPCTQALCECSCEQRNLSAGCVFANFNAQPRASLVVNAGGSIACRNCSFSDTGPASTLGANENEVAPTVHLRPARGIWDPARAWLLETRFAHNGPAGNAADIGVDAGCRVYSDSEALSVYALAPSADARIWRTSTLAPGEAGTGPTLRAASFATENSPAFQAIVRVRSAPFKLDACLHLYTAALQACILLLRFSSSTSSRSQLRSS